MSRHRVQVVAKRKAKSKRHADSRRRRVQAFESVLRMIGLKDFKEGLRSATLGQNSMAPPVRPRVTLAPDQEGDPDLISKLETLREVIESVSISIGRHTLSFPDFVSYALPLFALFRGEPEPTWSGKARRRFTEGGNSVRNFFEQYEDEISRALHHAILNFLLSHSRLDGPIYLVERATTGGSLASLVTYVLRRVDPEFIYLDVEGHTRKVYRCRSASLESTREEGGVDWDAEGLGLGSGSRLPVYVQKHAINQICERLLASDEDRGHLDYFVADSLRHPRLHAIEDDTYLVEMRINVSVR